MRGILFFVLFPLFLDGFLKNISHDRIHTIVALLFVIHHKAFKQKYNIYCNDTLKSKDKKNRLEWLQKMFLHNFKGAYNYTDASCILYSASHDNIHAIKENVQKLLLEYNFSFNAQSLDFLIERFVATLDRMDFNHIFFPHQQFVTEIEDSSPLDIMVHCLDAHASQDIIRLACEKKSFKDLVPYCQPHSEEVAFALHAFEILYEPDQAIGTALLWERIKKNITALPLVAGALVWLYNAWKQKKIPSICPSLQKITSFFSVPHDLSLQAKNYISSAFNEITMIDQHPHIPSKNESSFFAHACKKVSNLRNKIVLLKKRKNIVYNSLFNMFKKTEKTDSNIVSVQEEKTVVQSDSTKHFLEEANLLILRIKTECPLMITKGFVHEKIHTFLTSYMKHLNNQSPIVIYTVLNSFEFKNCFFAYQLSSASGSDFDRKKCTDVNDFIDLLKMKTSYVKNEIEVYKKAKQKKDSALYTKSILEKEMINCDKKISSILKMPLASL